MLKTLDSFEFKVQPSINQPLIRELMSGGYVDERENVLFIGNSGTGKTHLATTLAFSACQQGRKVRFFSATGMVTALLERCGGQRQRCANHNSRRRLDPTKQWDNR